MNTRKCSTCKLDLPETTDYFAMRYDKKSLQFQGICKKCHAEYRRKHYEKNKEKYLKKALDYKEKTRAWFEDLKSHLKCQNCGEDRWWVLDFHHRDPKKKSFTIGTSSTSVSKKKLLAEMRKCKVLCANCHRDLHYKAGDA